MHRKGFLTPLKKGGGDISQAVFKQSFSVNPQDSTPSGFCFSSDGLHFYMTGLFGDDVNQYDLTTAWDISTASYVRKFVIFSDNPSGIFFSPDGLNMYACDDHYQSYIHHYSLTTAWDVSTCSLEYSFASRSQDSSIEGIFMTADGLILFSAGGSNGSIYKYNLTTAWDLSTIEYSGQTLDVGDKDTAPSGLVISPDGSKFFFTGRSSDAVHFYNLSTPWGLSTAVYVSCLDTSLNNVDLKGLAFSSDWTKLYTLGSSPDTVDEYDIN